MAKNTHIGIVLNNDKNIDIKVANALSNLPAYESKTGFIKNAIIYYKDFIDKGGKEKENKGTNQISDKGVNLLLSKMNDTNEGVSSLLGKMDETNKGVNSLMEEMTDTNKLLYDLIKTISENGIKQTNSNEEKTEHTDVNSEKKKVEEVVEKPAEIEEPKDEIAINVVNDFTPESYNEIMSGMAGLFE